MMKNSFKTYIRDYVYNPRKTSCIIKIFCLVLAICIFYLMTLSLNDLKEEKVIGTEVLHEQEYVFRDAWVNPQKPDNKKTVKSEETFIHLPITVPHLRDINLTSVLVPGMPTRPGELGAPVILSSLTSEDQKKVDEGWERNAFNQFASDKISLHRSLPDIRPRGCLDQRFSLHLPKTSVIITFHNEAWSVLLRTVHSVLDRSPLHLIEEIILVDDFSEYPHLGKQLDDYMSSLSKVKIIRASKRLGLIRARLFGTSIAKGPVLTFLDSHCECAPGWLEPLLQRIHNNSTIVACPTMDEIKDETFQYNFIEYKKVQVGGFNWELLFRFHDVSKRESKRRKHHWDPVFTPSMVGGLFSISKDFFEKLGTYDSGFDIWGAENMELSFKTWMCGGSIEIVPCSHVGHVYRKRFPYDWGNNSLTVFRKNSIRVAEVWMDEYKQYYYYRIGHDLGDFGDVSSRKALRKRLNCKSFDWYVKNIYPELDIPNKAIAEGEIRNLHGERNMCIYSQVGEDDYDKPLVISPCSGRGGFQYWMLSEIGEIQREDACLDYYGREVSIYPCHSEKGNQLWFYDHEAGTIQHGGSSQRCLEMSEDKRKLLISKCDGNSRQKWAFKHYHASREQI